MPLRGRCLSGLSSLAFIVSRYGRVLPSVFIIVGASAGSVFADTSCSRPAPELPAASIQTDLQTYKVERTPTGGYAVSIGFVYTNDRAKPVYLPTCRGAHPSVLEKWMKSAWTRIHGKWLQGDWMAAYAPVVRACLGPPNVIAPGDQYSYTFEIEAAPRQSNTVPQFTVPKIQGTYRLVWEIYGSWKRKSFELNGKLPLRARVSNIFQITYQDSIRDSGPPSPKRAALGSTRR